MDIRPGERVTVEITANPTNAAARKTLARLYRRDPSVERLMRRQTIKRPSWQEWRRGAMTWHHQMQTRAPIRIERGARFSIRATLDVIRDLQSVSGFVKVAAG